MLCCCCVMMTEQFESGEIVQMSGFLSRITLAVAATIKCSLFPFPSLSTSEVGIKVP